MINHGLRDRLPYRCGVVRHVRLSCSWGCSAVDVEHATSDHFLQPKGKLNAHHVVLFLFLPSLGVKSSTTMPFFHVFFCLWCAICHRLWCVSHEFQCACLSNLLICMFPAIKWKRRGDMWGGRRNRLNIIKINRINIQRCLREPVWCSATCACSFNALS